MKALIAAYRNWRIVVLCLVGVMVLLLALCEADDWRVFLLTKAAAVGLWLCCLVLYYIWDDDGKLRELDDIEE
ncbi:MAG: hypothetical protein LUC22_00325 [Prevotella sp.]|nr:hypothetical protein [Prevotella sp.]